MSTSNRVLLSHSNPICHQLPVSALLINCLMLLKNRKYRVFLNIPIRHDSIQPDKKSIQPESQLIRLCKQIDPKRSNLMILKKLLIQLKKKYPSSRIGLKSCLGNVLVASRITHFEQIVFFYRLVHSVSSTQLTYDLVQDASSILSIHLEYIVNILRTITREY